MKQLISDERIEQIVEASNGATRNGLVRYALKEQQEAIADWLENDAFVKMDMTAREGLKFAATQLREKDDD